MLLQGTRGSLPSARPQVSAGRAARVVPQAVCHSTPERPGGGATPALAALLASACLVASAPALAATPVDPATEQLFTTSCAGCHAGGGNIVRRDHTLFLPDLQREGLTDVDAVYERIYSGEGSMPGFGVNCAPKLQCTFGPRLSDEEIRGLAVYVLDRAAANWAAAE